MTTTPTLTTAWTALCAIGSDFWVSLVQPGAEIEIATTDDGADPTLAVSHRLAYDRREVGKDSCNRALIGPGYVFARAITPSSLVVAFNAWNSNTLLLFTASTWDTSATWLTDRTWG